MQLRSLAPVSLVSLLLLAALTAGCDEKAGDTAGLGEGAGGDGDTDDADGGDGTPDTDGGDGADGADGMDTADGSDGTDDTDEDGDGYPSSEDCDDTNTDIHPDTDEICNGLDDDCDDSVDEEAIDPSSWYPDADADGYGDIEAAPVEACIAPTGTEVLNAEDCDDTNADINPGAVESCNEVDDNCNGDIDESGGSDWYFDADRDGFGDPTTATAFCDQASGYIADGTDCDDTDELVYPGATEACDGRYNDCADPSYDALGAPDDEIDDDGDLYVECEWDASSWLGDVSVLGGGDCDDTSTGLSPEATEVCDDGTDNDCDASADCDDADCASASECDFPPTCADDDLGSTTGTAVASGTSTGAGDDYEPGCGGSGGEDMAYAFTAPAGGCYVFSTASSGYDTMVAALHDCSVELDCNDDGGSSGTSRLLVGLSTNEEIVVVIDGFDSTASGSYQLDISTTTPATVTPDADLGSATGNVLASGTLPASNRSLETECDDYSDPGTDLVYLWTAPTTGTVTFDTESSSADTNLGVFDASCYTELDCDDDSGAGTTSKLQMDVVAGRRYLVRVGVFDTSASSGGSAILDINY